MVHSLAPRFPQSPQGPSQLQKRAGNLCGGQIPKQFHEGTAGKKGTLLQGGRARSVDSGEVRQDAFFQSRRADETLRPLSDVPGDGQNLTPPHQAATANARQSA